ncbi:MAG TPA: Asp-tRNA(Asn)/Glu-tRNA(Gln) amidotransferase GatCAB subunit B, partial [Phycisphaerae bacterium]|nr:Asp-tRNA(Asn)/Glu-tRNA(Gln) amidotransferase GatCAB subunit B [Phycisphaerae bacterium]
MRFEPNINLHITRDGKTYKTPIVEVKNLNSFKALTGTIAYEITRQYEKWLGDGDYTIEKHPKENRGYDDDRGITLFQRSKEEAHDYRYFPDPDLPPVRIDDAWRERLRSSIGELPLARKSRYIESFSLSENDAEILTQDVAIGDLLDGAISAGAEAKQCVKFLLGKASAIANERGCNIAEIGLTVSNLAELAKMVSAGEINATAGDKIFTLMIESDDSPKQIAKAQNLLAVSDAGQIAQWVDHAIAANAQAAEDVRSGGKKQKRAFGFLTGQVMQQSKGAAVPAEVQRLLREKFGM